MNWLQKIANDPALPQKLYHATPYLNEVLSQGFKLPSECQNFSFGGSSDTMSFTEFEDAQKYAEALRELVRLANGEYQWDRETLAYLIQKWEIKSRIEGWTPDSLIEHIEQEKMRFRGRQYNWDDNRALAEFLNQSGVLLDTQFPTFMGSLEPRGESIDNIGVVEITMVENADYSYHQGENEWRLSNPCQITSVKRVA